MTDKKSDIKEKIGCAAIIIAVISIIAVFFLFNKDVKFYIMGGIFIGGCILTVYFYSYLLVNEMGVKGLLAYIFMLVGGGYIMAAGIFLLLIIKHVLKWLFGNQNKQEQILSNVDINIGIPIILSFILFGYISWFFNTRKIEKQGKRFVITKRKKTFFDS